MAGGVRGICKKIPPWPTLDKCMLVGTVVSIVVLITTLYCVYYPYLETSTFYAAQCTPLALVLTGPKTCGQHDHGGCTEVPPNILSTIVMPTLTAPVTTPTVNPNYTQSSASSSASSASTEGTSATTTTTTTPTPTTTTTPSPAAKELIMMSYLKDEQSAQQAKQQQRVMVYASGSTRNFTTPPPGTNYCPWYPCSQLKVIHRSSTPGIYVDYVGQVYQSKEQLRDDPECSAKSCEDDSNDNVENVREWYSQYLNGKFSCYANFYNSAQVLTDVAFSYSEAVNSILWPIMSLLMFGTILICLRFMAWQQQCKTHSRTSSAVQHQTSYADSFPPVNYSAAADNVVPPPIDLSTAGLATAPGPFVFDLAGGPAGNAKSQEAFGYQPVGVGGATAYAGNPAPWGVVQPPQYSEAEGDSLGATGGGPPTGQQLSVSKDDGNGRY